MSHTDSSNELGGFPQNEDNFWGALDIGSNSFHFVYVREREQHLQTLYREKYPVQLASGLDKNGYLTQAAIDQALEVLTQLATIVANIPPSHFRAVATYTLRQAKNADVFLAQAKQVFPFDIDIISGHEEARLIYQGVAHNLATKVPRLIIDIGGGSTEFIIGQGFQIQELTSKNFGCVSLQKRFFADGVITPSRVKKAQQAVKQKLLPMLAHFEPSRWQQVIGTSGTIKAIYRLIAAKQSVPLHEMTAEQLHSLLTEFIQAKHISQLNYAALSDKRRSVIVPGLCALTAIVDMLAIEKLSYCDYALRDGLLAELTESVRYHDVRERTIQSLQQRFSVDQQQANNVVAIAQDILRALESKCQSSEMIYTKLLRWSCLLHEIGLDINSSDFHIHGSYIIKHTDLAGFTLEQQYALAWLIRNQRKKIQPINAKYLHQLSGSQLNRLLVILRLSVLLAQQRNLVNVSNVAFAFQSAQLEIRLPQDWLTQRQLLMNQLLNEQRVAKKLGLQLRLCVEASLRSDAVENGN